MLQAEREIAGLEADAFAAAQDADVHALGHHATTALTSSS